MAAARVSHQLCKLSVLRRSTSLVWRAPAAIYWRGLTDQAGEKYDSKYFDNVGNVGVVLLIIFIYR